ncbi:MAG: aminotransferase class III-fold pyridoxal phosphate-dependent enzyme [Saprospiraceae bacterium]|nr:aminotransferase class III-fold pyridoxal phosphate-dependent enzyme [Saprospiraceae bacterium]
MFSEIQLKTIAKENYNLICEVSTLAGDVDYNFLLQATNGINYLLKICKPKVTANEIDFQVKLLQYLEHKKLDFAVPQIVPTHDGKSYFIFPFENETYTIRMHTWVEGKLVSEVNPRTKELYLSWGETCGELSKVLKEFDHPGAHRFDIWNPVECLHSRPFIEYFQTEKQKNLASYFWKMCEDAVLPLIPSLRKSVNYGDAHEHNLLVGLDPLNSKIQGVIDFGDAIFAPTICELAIACAYAAMYVPDPMASMAEVVRGYHQKFSIEEVELTVLFPLICGRLMITVANAAKNFNVDPTNEYHQISASPAWEVLHKFRAIAPQFAHYYFRDCCGLEAHPNAPLFKEWIESNPSDVVSPIDLNGKKVVPFDLSVDSLDLGNNRNFETIPRFSQKINELLLDKNAAIGIGGYGEIRPFYTTDAYKIEGNNGPQWRTMHLGTDFWMEAGTPVQSFCDGEIIAIHNNDNPCDYGPTVIVEHKLDSGLTFYTLYGHLNLLSLEHCKIGQKVKRGETIAWIGEAKNNGGWPPHLHFQITLDLLGNKHDFPGVAYVSESSIWLSVCPQYPTQNVLPIDVPELLKSTLYSKRKNVLGKVLSISYRDHLHMVRGSGVYLYDTEARRYIDTVNNVAHVGHEHPRVVRAGSRQMEVLNTNTRYLHDGIVNYAEAILKHCPEEMEVVYFVNSGSEANELALRMAKVYSGQKDVIALESGYHGNTGACIDISSYKFDGKGGKGAPEHTSICRIPDTYRGAHKQIEKAGAQYAQDIAIAIENIKSKGRNVACFIAESILSCGGQIVLPPHYLETCYQLVRETGGLVISDEVQVGFGRVGSHFWGFELQGVVPDIITCGKPIGNGHPLAAVITTRAVAEAFTNGMEFFNTFGGNPVSCAIGNEVLSIIEDQNLQHHALEMGDLFKRGLTELQKKYPIIGDVRGHGLFLGFELVTNRSTLEPAAKQATYLANRMRTLGVLMSTDGPLYNVIKIKPPMCITHDHVKEVLMRLDQVLQEEFMIV